jgi:hypothetical protein
VTKDEDGIYAKPTGDANTEISTRRIAPENLGDTSTGDTGAAGEFGIRPLANI